MQTLHWLGPAVTAIYFMTARSVAFCMLTKPNRNAGSRLRNRSAVAITTIIFLLFLAQSLVYLIQFIQDPRIDQASDGSRETVYLLGSSLLWGTLLAGLFPMRSRIWYPFVGAWALCFLVDGTLLFLGGTNEHKTGLEVAQTVIQTVRVILLMILTGSTFAFLVTDLCHREGEEDSEPLLGTAADPTKPAAYGSIPEPDDYDSDAVSDFEDAPERDKELKKQQQQRLQERGNWLAYLKDFRILLPLIWPSDNLYVLCCFVVLVAILAIDRAFNVLVPRQMGFVVDRLTTTYGTGVLPWKELGLWMLFKWLESRAGLGAILQFVQLPLEQYGYRQIGTTSFRHIMALSMEFHNNKNSGELMAAIGQGQQLYKLVDFVLLHAAPMFLDLIVAFIYVANLFDANMALIVLFVGLSYTWVGMKIAGLTVKKRRRFNKAWREESKTQAEAIHNWQTVSHFNREKFEVDRYTGICDDLLASEQDYYHLQYYGGALQSLILLIGRTSAALLAAYRVSQGRAPIGSFVTLITYWSTIESPLASMSYSIRQLSQMLIDSERLLELLNTKPTVTELPNAAPLHITNAKVEFRNVSFSYDPRKPTLSNISFTANPGQTIALVGETGGGKTTLLKLLYRYYDADASGAILIDGTDIRTCTLDSLRDTFGMVPQDPALFNTSILENVRYARLDAPDTAVHAACRAAAIHDKILTFPDGYASTVGERGVKLSGGELQRVAIARAILRDPAIVILDEATSQIDAETESVIQSAFRELTKGRTTFVVAHRLSTIQHADLILVIGNGEVVERGSHEELFRLGGRYTGLWAKQSQKQMGQAVKAVDA